MFADLLPNGSKLVNLLLHNFGWD